MGFALRHEDLDLLVLKRLFPAVPIEWRPTPGRNVEVLNDTADLYRYFDCTEAAEFLYACVARAIDKDLPREIDFLRRNDEALCRIMNTVEMPDRMAENLVRFIRQNEGKLGRQRREGEFEKLTDEEVTSIEAIVREAFAGFEDQEYAPPVGEKRNAVRKRWVSGALCFLICETSRTVRSPGCRRRWGSAELLLNL
jgi:hypothetical protein